MNAAKAWKRVVVLSALALLALAYGTLPAFAEEPGAKARESKQAPGMQQSPAGPAGQAGGAVTAPGTPPDTPSEAAGSPPPPKDGVIGDTGRGAMSGGDARSEGEQPPIPGSEGEQPPRPPGPVEAPPGD